MRRVASPIALSLALFLAACGGGDSKDNSAQAKAFCKVADPVKALSGVLETEDPAKTKATFEAAEAALNAVAGDPPKGIAADLATVKATFAAANDAMKKAGYKIDAVDAAGKNAVVALEDGTFTKAADGVTKWTAENCK